MDGAARRLVPQADPGRRACEQQVGRVGAAQHQALTHQAGESRQQQRASAGDHQPEPARLAVAHEGQQVVEALAVVDPVELADERVPAVDEQDRRVSVTAGAVLGGQPAHQVAHPAGLVARYDGADHWQRCQHSAERPTGGIDGVQVAGQAPLGQPGDDGQQGGRPSGA